MCTFREKLNIDSQQEGIEKWKEHFKNLLENYPKVAENLSENYR